jgi:CO dehydrogenase/acetyl-CoA synthase epsilon subunit
VSVKAEPWQKAEIAGPKKALLIMKPEVVSALWTRAKRPIIIVGHHVIEEDTEYEPTIDHVIRLCKATNTPLVVTAHTSKVFIEQGFQPTAIMSLRWKLVIDCKTLHGEDWMAKAYMIWLFLLDYHIICSFWSYPV